MKSSNTSWQGSFQIIPFRVGNFSKKSLRHLNHTYFQLLSLTIVLFLLVILTFPLYSNANEPTNTFYWNAIYESGSTRASSVDQTLDGGFIVASWFDTSSRQDGLVLKLDQSGKIEWQQAYGGSDSDDIVSVKQTNDGGFIAVGTTGSFGEGKVWVLKLDGNGNIIWQKAYGGEESESLQDVVQTTEGGYILAGMTESFGASGADGWLVKLDKNGGILWQKRYGGEYWSDEFRDIELTDDGNYIVTGEVGPSNSYEGDRDLWVLKLDDNGEVIWQRKYGGTQTDTGSSIKQVTIGGYVVAGHTDSFGSGEDDFWVIKLDTQGNVIWQKMYGGSEREAAFSIWPDRDGGYLVAGRADSFSDLRNGWILGLKSTGEIKWQHIYGGNILLSGQQLADKGHIVIGDSFTSGNTCWIMKLNNDGEISISCTNFNSTNIFPVSTTAEPSEVDISPVTTSATQIITDVEVRTTDLTKNEICSSNKPPESGFIFSPDNPPTDSPVTFDASNSSDPDGSIETYKWDWDDDGAYENTLFSPTVDHSFSSAGDYSVTLKVVDDDDASDTTTKTLTVEDTTPPDATITSGPSGEIDYRNITFGWTGSDNVTATSDLTYSYKLEGEDGSWSNWTNGTSKSYSDLSNGEYTFKVKAKDEAGNVYSSPPEQTFSVLLTEPGTKRWRYKTGWDVNSSPAIGSDGTIYVGSGDNFLYAIKPDGTLKWRYETGDSVLSSPAIGSDGTIYVGSEDNYLYAISQNGNRKWRYETENGVNFSPVVGDDGTIYFGSTDEYLYAIKPDGSRKWRHKIGYLGYSSPAIGDNGTIYVSTPGYLCAINPDGSSKWRYDTGTGGGVSAPAIGSDGTIYVGFPEAFHGHLHAVNPDGTLKWRYEMEDDVRSSPAIGDNGIIYVGSHDNYLHAVNPDGTLKWRYEMGHWIRSSPVIGDDGTIYVGSLDDYLYAINGNSGGLADSPWPMFQRDLKHTGRVADANLPPKAAFTFSPDSPEPGETITFDASSSSDSDGNITQYKWDWDDDGNYEDTSPTIEHSYSTAGSYSVTLKVIDNGGATDTSTQTVTVEDTIPPDPNPMAWSSEPSALGTDTIEMEASSATDPEGNGVEYYFEETTGNSGGRNSNWQDSNNYTDTGLESGTEYCYRVKARDKSSNQNKTDWSTTKCATIENQAPEAAFTYTPDNPITEETITFDASDSSDPDGTVDTYKWDWTDDGSYDTTTSSATTTHSYGDNGTYTVRLQVVDDDGATDTITKEVTVQNQAPTADAGPDRKISLHETATLDGTGSSDPDDEIESYTWSLQNPRADLDDILTDPGSPTPKFFPNSQGPGSGGKYIFVLEVEDDDGATATDTVNVLVNPAPLDIRGNSLDSKGVQGTNPSPADFTGKADLEVDLDNLGSNARGLIGAFGYEKANFPSEKKFSGDVVKYVDVKAIDINDGTARISLHYTDKEVSQFVEDTLKLFVYNGTWKDATNITVDTNNNVVSGDVDVSKLTGSPVTASGNEKPVSDFEYSPTSPIIGEEIEFNASGSSDPDGSVTSYSWDWTDDGDYDADSETATHTYTGPGTYTVKLKVKDDEGATASTTKDIEVNIGAVDEVSVVASSQTLPSDGKANTKLTATAKNSVDYPVRDATVDFSTQYGTLSSSSAVTDTSGQASVTLTAPDEPNESTLKATAGGKSGATIVFFQEPGGPDVEGSSSQVVESGQQEATMDSQEQTGTSVTVRKTAEGTDEEVSVTAAKFEDNPQEKKALNPSSGGYMDVHVDNPDALKETIVKFYLDPWPEKPRVKYWNSKTEDWENCSEATPYPDEGYVQVRIGPDTTPDLSYLSGGQLAAGGLDTEYIQVKHPGWSMVSVPLDPEKGNYSDPTYVFKDLDTSTIFHWDPTQEDYLAPEDGYKLVAMQGNWVWAADADVPQAFSVTGVYKGDVTINLKYPGWHQVGPSMDYGWSDIGVTQGEDNETMTVAEQASSPSSPHWISRFLWDYNSGTGGYTAHDASSSTDFNLKPGKAYWVKTYEPNVKLVVPYATPPPVPTEASVQAKGIPMGSAKADKLDIPNPPAVPTTYSIGEFSINATPNPLTSNDGVTFIAAGAKLESFRVNVYDASGKQIHASKRQSDHTYTWKPESGLSNGLYLYQVTARKSSGQTIAETGKLLVLQ